MNGDQYSEEAVIETQDSLQESMMARAKKIADTLDRLMETPEERTDEGVRNQIEVTKRTLAGLMARYGIDAAMLASKKGEQGGFVDETLMAKAPFSKEFNTLVYYLADALGVRHVYISNRVRHGGTGRNRYGERSDRIDYGYRLFGYRSDVERLKVMYSIARNAALAGVSRVRGTKEFGQDTRLMKIDWLDGFNGGIYKQVEAAERDARKQAEAEQQDRMERLVAEGITGSETSVAVVLADRSAALNVAFDLSNGITPEIRAERKAESEKWNKEYQERAEARAKEISECARCQAAKTGRCKKHRERSWGRTYYRQPGQYEGTQRAAGYQAGLSTHLGSQTGVSDTTGRGSISR